MSEKPVILLQKAAIYQNRNLVLNNVNLSIEKGEFVYLVGKTGSGKSTLLKTLYGQLPLLTGEGYIAGAPLHKMKWKNVPKLRRRLGIIFQDFNLLTDRSIEENLLFVLKATNWKKKKDMQNRITDLLEKVGLKHKRESRPYELSGGEQQRVAIARALLNDPKVIIADEPTGNLDPDTSDEIIQLLRHLQQEKDATVLMATHDYYIVEKYPGRLIRVKNGGLFDEEDFVIDKIETDDNQ